jgi:hypothetical protein
MPRPVTCPHCGEELDIPAEFRGREVRCAACDQVFTPPTAEPPTASRAGRDYDDDRPSRRPARDDFDRWDDRPRRRKQSTAWVWALLIGVFTLCILPCGGFMVWAIVLAFPDFEPYSSPDGKYRAEFPGKTVSFTTKSADGPDRTCVEFKRNFPPETFFVHHTDLPAAASKEPDRALKEACDKALAQTPGSTELYRTSTTYDGYPAMDHAVEHPDGGGTVTRFVLAGRRLYAVGISCESGIDATEPRAEHFLNAFKVTATDPVK